MKKYLIQIEDTKRRRFHIEVLLWPERPREPYSLSHVHHNTGMWNAINKGFITSHGGEATRWQARGATDREDLDLFLEDGLQHSGTALMPGMILRNFIHDLEVRDSGTGEVAQGWVLALEPGLIQWRRPNVAEVVAADLQRRPGGSP